MTTNFNTFADAVKTELAKRLADYEIAEQTIIKMNDITMHGLVARRSGENAGATVYLDEAFDSFLRGESIVSIAKTLTDIVLNAEAHKPVAVNSNLDMSFEAVKDKLTLRLVDIAKNEKYLEEHPCRFVGAGLAVVAEINLPNDFSIVINNSMAEDYDIIALFDTAEENMRSLYPARLISLESAIFGNGENALESDQRIEGMYTLMIEAHGFGASAIIYEGIAERIKDLFGSGYYILPSSLHEVILLKDDETVNTDNLKAMVVEANRTVVDPSDVLSDDVFHFGADGLRRVA